MPVPFSLMSIKSLALEEIQRLRKRYPDITPLLFRTGEFLVREGDRSQDLFIMLQGTVEIEQSAASQGLPASHLARLTCDVDSFCIIGEMAYLDHHVRTASVKVLEPTHTLRLLPFHLDAMMEECPMLTRVLCQQFAQRLREANEALRQSRAKEF